MIKAINPIWNFKQLKLSIVLPKNIFYICDFEYTIDKLSVMEIETTLKNVSEQREKTALNKEITPKKHGKILNLKY